MAEIFAEYNGTSFWDTETLGFDLGAAEDWYIKWDVLYVKFHNKADYQEYKPTIAGIVGFFNSMSIEIDGKKYIKYEFE